MSGATYEAARGDVMSKSDKALGYFISTALPELEAWVECPLTPDQQDEYRRLQKHYLLAGKCFRAICELRDKPLEDFPIHPLHKKLAEQEANILFELWRVIQEGFKAIRQQAKQYDLYFPFRTSKELFQRAVLDRIRSQFSVCLQPYSEVSLKRTAKAAKVALTRKIPAKGTKEYGLGREFRAEVDRIRDSGIDDWEILSLHLAQAACKTNPRKYAALQKRLNSHWDDLDYALETDITASRRRGQWKAVIEPSFVWHNGVKRPLT